MQFGHICLGAGSAEADISDIDLYNVCSLLSNFNEFEKCDPGAQKKRRSKLVYSEVIHAKAWSNHNRTITHIFF